MNRLRVVAILVCTIFLFSLVLIPLSACATPSATTVPATTGSGAIVDLAISGNITSSQMSSVTIATNKSADTTGVSFTVIGESGTTGFSNITIPKSAVPYGITPTIYIDSQQASNQGFTQDSKNYYVWYTTSFSTHGVSIGFSTHGVSIVFTKTSPSPSPTVPEFPAQLLGITLVASMIAVLSAVIIAKKKQPSSSFNSSAIMNNIERKQLPSSI